MVDIKQISHDAATATVDFVTDQATYISRSLKKSDGIDRICKVVCAAIDVISLFFGKEPIGQSLRGRIKEFRELFTTGQLFLRIQDWVCNKKDADRPFWRIDNTVVIIAHAIFTAAQALEAIQFFGTVGLINLGKIAEKIGNIPVFGIIAKSTYPIIGIVKDILYMISSGMLVIDRAFIIHKARGKAVRNQNKMAKWEQRKQSLKEAFPESCKDRRDGNDDNGGPGSIAKRSGLLDQFEYKIVAGQLELQNSMLDYVSSREGIEGADSPQKPVVVSYKGVDAPGRNLLRLQIIAQGQQNQISRFLENITNTRTFPTTEEMRQYSNKSRLFQEEVKQLENYLSTTERPELVKSDLMSLRNQVLVLSEGVNKLSHLMIAESRDIAADGLSEAVENQLKTKLATIDNLHTKLTKWQNMYDAIGLYEKDRNRKDKIEEMFEKYTWKKQKWATKQANNDVKQKKAWWFLADMACKFIGASVSLFLNFLPPAKLAVALAEAGFLVLSNAVPRIAEITKVGISAIGALVSYSGGYSTELIKKKDIPARPAVVRVRSRVNPTKVDGGAMEALVLEVKKPPVTKDKLRQMQEVVVDKIRCVRGKNRLRFIESPAMQAR